MTSTIIFLIFGLYILTFVLIKSADHTVFALRHLTKSSGSKSAFIFSALLLAMATSFPELFVAISSALKQTPSLSLGNIIGANIANLSLVAGTAALLSGRVVVKGKFLEKDVAIALIAGLLPLIFIVDGLISRSDGVVLLAIYAAYALSFFKNRFLEIGEEIKRGSFVHKFFRTINHIDTTRTKELGRLIFSLALLLISAKMIVDLATQLAVLAKVPVFLVGLILLSIGTTLPELGFSLRALQDKEPPMFFGNLLGSIVVNSTLILGLAAVITPIKVAAIGEYAIAAISFVVIFSTFWFFIRSKRSLERWEAAFLLVLYAVFVICEFI